MRGVSTRLQRLEDRCEQRTIRRMAQAASVHLGIGAGELAAELAQVLAECRAAGVVSYDETLRYFANRSGRSPEVLHREAEALRKAMG